MAHENQELKQTRAINETASRISEVGSQISEAWKKSQETNLQKELERQEEPPVIIDTDTANILHLMGAQSNPQLQLKTKKTIY